MGVSSIKNSDRPEARVTPAEWFASTDPAGLLSVAAPAWGPRRARLFVVACCRRHHAAMPTDACRDAVDVAEQFADGHATPAELDAPNAGPPPRTRIISPGPGGSACCKPL